MLDNFNKLKFKFKYSGLIGLPESYPTPKADNLLFYIQRNHNINTVVYLINFNSDGTVNENHPLDVYWVHYETGGIRKELNLIQDRLAYGYNSWKINNSTFRFQIVSYPDKEFYIAKDDAGTFRAFTRLEDKMSIIQNIYFYAEEFGAFPQVKFIEFFGSTVDNDFPIYQKTLL